MSNLILTEDGSPIRDNQFEKVVTCQIIDIGTVKGDLDIWMDKYVCEKISKAYDNIFIPICFGQTKSDFMGLRLAMHIRTTEDHPCQLSNIIFYGPASIKEIITFGGELYQLISTKGIDFIDFSKYDISEHLGKKKILIDKEQLRVELNKITLSIPSDYFDSHSIANLWGAFRLAKVANINVIKIESLKNKEVKLKSIYFKWLMFLNDATDVRNEEVLETERVSNKKLEGTNLKGYIDLSKIPKK